MATSRLPVPAPMELTGDMKANWKFFKAQWDNYEIATGLDEKEEKVRVATLLSVMGKDCFQIFQHMEMSDTDRTKIDKILQALKAHFESKTNVIYVRYVSNTSDQGEQENIDKYVTRLRQLSNSCEFDTLAK